MNNNPHHYHFLVFPVVDDELGDSFAYVQEYLACREDQTNPEGLPTATAILGRGKTAYQALADLCEKLDKLEEPDSSTASS